MTLVPTQEQLAIIEAAGEQNLLKVSAAAGGAKTSTLVMVANAYQEQTLYLAYNKRMAEEARGKFPSWVEVRTTHSMAYAKFGKEIAHKLSRPQGAYKNVSGTPTEIARTFKITPFELRDGQILSSVFVANAVKETVNAFEYSADKTVTKDHVSYSNLGRHIVSRNINSASWESLIQGYAQRLWRMRCDPNDSTLATHDTYLKMFQLSGVTFDHYPRVMLDEAQDSNACVLDIVLRHRHKTVLVGDTFQSIYQWRGSVNAMEKVDAPERKLSKSFRFGEKIADVAKIILSNKLDVQGFEKIDSSVFIEGELPKKHTKIFRTNAGLLEEAVDILTTKPDVKLYIEVDFRDTLEKIKSTVALFHGETKNVKHGDLKMYEKWEDFVAESEFSLENKRLVNMVATGVYALIVDALEKYTHPVDPDIIYITAHKSKGLEWDHVVLADDYPDALDAEGNYKMTEAERNLLYVASTRGKLSLKVNGIVDSLFMYHGVTL